MLILKHNELPVEDLFIIERHLVRWLDHKGPTITPEWHVLELSRTDLYGHLLGVFAHLKVLEALAINPSQLLDFLVDVDTAYLHTPYHSFYHAADILIMLYYILIELDGSKHLSAIETAPILIAALCHDMGHPGYNNLYQVNSNTPLAQRYNNTSVLENYSVDITQDLLIKHKLFDNVSYDWKNAIKRLILSTDMVYHYELQEKTGVLGEVMGSTWSDDEEGGDGSDEEDEVNGNDNDNEDEDDDDDSHDSSDTDSLGLSEPPPTPTTIDQTLSLLDHRRFESPSIPLPRPRSSSSSLLSPSQRHDFCRIILHAADISNTVRPWSISKQWSDLIVQEFFQQGDAEKLAGLAISPGMDRDQSNQATISLKFGDFVVKPYFESLARLLPKSRVFLKTLAENRLEWIKLKDSPIPSVLTPPPPSHERHFPDRLLPSIPVPNPSGRRVSVPAGLIIIPDHHWGRQKYTSGHPLLRRRHHHPRYRISKSPSPQQHLHLPQPRFTKRSASHPIVIPGLDFHRSGSVSLVDDDGQHSRSIQAEHTMK